MDEAKAREVLTGCIEPDGQLYNLGWYLAWTPGDRDGGTLDGTFTVEELEAIVWWIRNAERRGEQ